MDLLIGFYTIFQDKDPIIFSLIRTLEDTGLDYNPEKLEENIADGIFSSIRSVLPKDFPRKNALRLAKESGELIKKLEFKKRKYLGMVLDKDMRKILVSPEKAGLTDEILSKMHLRKEFDKLITKQNMREDNEELLRKVEIDEGILVASSPSLLKAAGKRGLTTVSFKKDLEADHQASDFLDVFSILEE